MRHVALPSIAVLVFALLTTPALPDCSSTQAQEVMSYLTDETDIQNYRMIRCQGFAAQTYENRAKANKNRARLQGEAPSCQHPTVGYQLQLKHGGQWFASDTYLTQWGCSDARWAPDKIGARCVKVSICGVE